MTVTVVIGVPFTVARTDPVAQLPDQERIDAYAGAPEFDTARPDAFYHDNWWIYDAVRGVYSGLGINGQTLLVHHPSRTVVVKLFAGQAVQQ